jgi:hypothetical protein
MGDRTEIEPDESLKRAIYEMVGLNVALDALGGDKPKSSLPGFAMAVALVQKEAADQRASLSGAVYRCAAKAGHDVANVAGIYTTIKNGKPIVEIAPMDLVDQAES